MTWKRRSPPLRSTREFVWASAPSFNCGSNGVYEGPLITMARFGRGLFEFNFDLKQSSVLLDLNWRGGLSGLEPTVLAIYDSNNQLLESFTVDRSDPTGFVGFRNRATADIAKLTITGQSFGLRNMSVSDAVATAPYLRCARSDIAAVPGTPRGTPPAGA